MKKMLSLSLLLTLAAAVPAWAGPTITRSTASAVAKVTVYNGQAMALREIPFKNLQPGYFEVAIQDMPINLNKDSIRVTGTGSASALIHNVELTTLEQLGEDPEMAALTSRLEGLEQRLAVLNDSDQVGNQSQAFVNSVSEISQDKIKKQLAYYQIQTAHWQEMMKFVAANQAAILAQKRQNAQQRKKIAQEMEKLQKTMAELYQKKKLKNQAAVVYFTVTEPGDLTLQLNYLIGGVNWTPSYDAMLDDKAGQLQLTYFGDIVQNTGEDWNNVQVNLSTATPILNASVPLLSPWYLTSQFPFDNDANKSKEEAVSNEGFAAMGDRVTTTESGGISYAESLVETQGLSVRFGIPQPISIKSSSNPRRVAIATRRFPYASEYQVVPKLSPLAFLTARFTNKSDLPLLAGAIRNYVDLDYTGTGRLPLIRPGEEAVLNFGVDPSIKVGTKVLKSDVSVTGMLQDIKQYAMAYEIQTTNFKQKEETLIVLDQLPISQDEKIKLKIVKITPKPTEEMDNNIFKWKFRIKPWEKKTIAIEYQIEHPKDMEVYTNYLVPDQENPVEQQERFRGQKQYQKL